MKKQDKTLKKMARKKVKHSYEFTFEEIATRSYMRTVMKVGADSIIDACDAFLDDFGTVFEECLEGSGSVSATCDGKELSDEEFSKVVAYVTGFALCDDEPAIDVLKGRADLQRP